MKTYVIGLGNRLFGDDYIGTLLVEVLSKSLQQENIVYVPAELDIYYIVELANESGIDRVIIIDAAIIDEDFRIICLQTLDDIDTSLDRLLPTSTSHDISTLDAVRILLSLRPDLRGRIYLCLLGVKPDNLKYRECISADVVDKAVRLIGKIFELNLLNVEDATYIDRLLSTLREKLNMHICKQQY